MTSREFSGVDHDLLADYVGGALDGTPEQATVARLVEEDPAWGDAYAALARAVDLVRADLAAWAAAPAPELPLAVADRITAALAGAGPAPQDEAVEGASAVGDTPARTMGADRPVEAPARVPAQSTARRAGSVTRSGGGTGTQTGPGRRRRRWARMAGPVAVAAASMAAVGLGIGQLLDARGDAVDGTTADSAAGGEAAPMAAPFRTTAPPHHSGTDYGPEQLSARASALSVPTAAAGESEKSAGVAPQDQRIPFAAGLDRLTRTEALNSCLTAISAEHGSGPVVVDLIDYASFQGRPALVVTFVDANGARWAWVTGPECGVPGSGADTRFRTRVG